MYAYDNDTFAELAFSFLHSRYTCRFNSSHTASVKHKFSERPKYSYIKRKSFSLCDGSADQYFGESPISREMVAIRRFLDFPHILPWEGVPILYIFPKLSMKLKKIWFIRMRIGLGNLPNRHSE